MRKSAPNSSPSLFPPALTWLGIALALAGVVAFLLLTPPDLLTKMDYIAAAVCHRIPSHSFFIEEHQLPLCQRCSGTFPGALTGVLLQWVVWRRRRAQRFPSWPIVGLLLGFAALWGLDGFNSYTTLLTGRPEGFLGYAPQPWLRVLSGVLMGMAMSVVLVPAFNQTMWHDGESRPALRSWHEVLLFIAIELVVGALMYIHFPLLLYPIVLYSVAGVVIMFVLLGAMIFVMILGRDATLTRWREAWVPLVWGLVFALFIVLGMGLVRVQFFGTIEGLPGIS